MASPKKMKAPYTNTPGWVRYREGTDLLQNEKSGNA
jgi:hypothetical protein